MEFHHVSILLQPCLDALNIKPDGVYVDATTGGAGHSLRIAQELGEGGRLICIDRDDEALENAKTRLASVWDRVTTVKSDFRDIDRVLEGQGPGADGILFDLGVSLSAAATMRSAVLLLYDRTRRSICAWTVSRRSLRGMWSNAGAGRTSGTSCSNTARSAMPR